MRKSQITDFMRKTDYDSFALPPQRRIIASSRHLIGSSGYLGYMDMLTMFFKNDGRHYQPYQHRKMAI